ncbi:MAG: response regulator [Gammaproteobacteria bacterium]|nr:response regulator [Gammaproteobacteria bacterium]HRX69890.1 response regulator [Candidatus Competibacteraceae bacterium]
MQVSEESIAALEAEVAEALGILESLPAENDSADQEQVRAVIRRYIGQVERISVAASEAGLLGLQDTCLLFQENLTVLDANARNLSDAERERLEEWPTLVIGYLMAPDDPQASEALLDHLQSPVWSMPLAVAEADVLRDLLTPTLPPPLPTFPDENKERRDIDSAPPVLAPSTAEAAPDLSADTIEETAALDAAVNLVTEEPAATETATLDLPADAVAEEPAATETAALDLPIDAVEETTALDAAVNFVAEKPTAMPPPVAADLDTLVEKVEETALDVTTEQAREEASVLLPLEPFEAASEIIGQESASSSVTVYGIEPAAAIEEQASERPIVTASGMEPTTATSRSDSAADAESQEPDNAITPFTPNAAQQELLEILCAEIVQMAEVSDEMLTIATAADSTGETRSEALSGYAEYLERLGEASASINLTGLQQACIHLYANLLELATQDDPLRPEQRDVVETWPALTLGYLQALNDRSKCEALTQCLQDARWPQPLTAADAAALTDLLFAPELTTEEAEAEVRPQQAQPDDISLDLPADVNQDLLDGLLQELPHQAADFSAAIQRLAAGDGQPTDVEVARRIAHTLKGAGNTVGVRGIATLTHHMEDILQALAKQGVLPNRPLADMLLNAADCLETMSEALLGMSEPPPQALVVLQAVLDWANRIDRFGVPVGDEIPPPPAVTPESVTAAPLLETAAAPLETAAPSPPEAAAAPPSAAATPETVLRVSAYLVDNLLRLVGESIILTGQLQERIRKTITQTRTVAMQNRLLQNLTAELEQLADIRNVSSPLSKSIQRSGFDPLELEQYNEINTVTHRLVEAAADAREMNRAVEDNLVLLDSLLVDQARLHRDSQEAVLRTRMVPIQTIVPRLQRTVRQTCRLVDKEAELVVRGADTPMDSNVLNDMVDPLMHILRNAVDHGIESPPQRQRLGKPQNGRIELRFMREGDNIVIHCRDDGAGLDLPAIRRTAEERGLIASDKPLEPDELARLILLPGFSTRDTATQTSGRGIGMDMVYSRLLEMKGSLRLQTEAGKGCLMELRLPVTLISTHALLLRVREHIYALSDRGVEQILYSGAGQVQTLGNATTYRLGNDVHEFTSLETLLNLPEDPRQHSRNAPPVLLVREETGSLRAVLVQEVLDSRDLVVKNMGQYIPQLPGIIGATILGDGSVAPVLDLPELLRTRTIGQQWPAAVQPALATASVPQRRIVLAVDDSLSARRSLAQFVRDAGFEVRTARDGLEAIEIINSKRPDLVLADLEMPRMNGLELTAHLRANQATSALPVIMITSRSTAKHRHEAEAAGVDMYLTKPFMEDDLLEQIHRLLRA